MDKYIFNISSVPDNVEQVFIGSYVLSGNSSDGIQGTYINTSNEQATLNISNIYENQSLYEVVLNLDKDNRYLGSSIKLSDSNRFILSSVTDDTEITVFIHKVSKVSFVEVSDIVFNAALLGDTSKITIDSGTLYFVKTLDSEGNFISGKLYKGSEPYTTDAEPVYVSKEGKNSSAIGTLNFADSWVGVTPKGDGTVDIKFPFNIAKMTASNFNSTGGASNNTVTATVDTESRYVAIGGDYPMGDWKNTASRTVIDNTVESIIFATGSGQVFWIPDDKTTFSVKLTYSDSTTSTVITEVIGPITGNGTFTSTGGTKLVTNTSTKETTSTSTTGGNCSATITNWSDDFMGYKASVSISVNYKTMLGGAGRFSLEVSHSNGGKPVSKADLFYDDNPGAGSIESVSLALGTNKPTKWLSGVEYYTGGLTLNATLSKITGVFNKSFVLNVGNITSNIASGSYTVSNLTESSNYTAIKYNDSFESYTQTLTVANGTNNTSKFTSTGQFKTTSDDITINATCGNSWNSNTTTGTAINLDKPLNTYIDFSGDTYDHFQDENYRLSVNKTTGIATIWDKKSALDTDDLKLDNGTWLVNTSGSSQVYYRNFKPSTGSAMNLMVSLVGSGITKARFGLSTGFDIELSLDGKNWYSLSSDDATKPIFASSNSLDTTGKSGNIGAQFGSDANGNQLATGNSSFKIGDTTQTNSVLCRITISNTAVKLDSIKIVSA